MKGSPKETILMPHLVTKATLPSDNSLGGVSEQLKFEEALKKLNYISSVANLIQTCPGFLVTFWFCLVFF